MRKTTLAAAICAALLPAAGSHAGEREDLLKLQATTMSLIEALVKEGVLSQEGADKLLAEAKQKAAAEVQRTAEQAPADTAQPAGNSQDVRVTYVPQFVRDEIRDQVRAG